MKEYYKSPFTIYVVWHHANEFGVKYGEALYNTFCRDTHSPLTRGLGIPVYFRFEPASGCKVPVDIDMTASERNAIVLLVDDEMFLDAEWKVYVESLLKKESNTTRVFPVALSSYALSLDEERLSKRLFIDLSKILDNDKQKELADRIEVLKSRLLHDVARMFYHLDKVSEVEKQMVPPPITLFVSHAKIDGEEMAKKFKDYVVSNFKLKTFFDVNDIADSEDLEAAITNNLKRSVFVVFLSDQYSSREWCRIEVIVAKRNKSPIVVVNNIQIGERRSFPYLGNVPTIRYNSHCFDAVIDLALFQVLNNLFLDEKLKKEIELYELDKKYKVFSLQSAPELFNYIDIKRLQQEEDNREILVIYPDPPLGTEELKVLNDLDPNISFITPTLIHNI